MTYVPSPGTGTRFCGHCGAAITAGATFCGRCGAQLAPPPPAATGYTYPAMPPAAVSVAHRRLPATRLLLLAGGALAVLVVVITVVVVAAQPAKPKPCTFACGPPLLGPVLLSSTAYHNDQWGYSVDYASNVFSVAGNDADSVTLTGGSQGLPLVRVAAVAGTDVKGALQKEIDNLGNEHLQVQQQGGVPGAEVGEISGSGVYLSGSYTQQGSTPVAVDVIAATNGKYTIVVTATDTPSQRNTTTGISSWDTAFVVSEVRW